MTETTASPGRPGRPAPKVSVIVVTFNQAAYIARCLKSILSQETPFAFEVIVGDDASTDGTTDIVRQFAKQHPGRVRALLHPENLGPFANYRATHLAAEGEYVAHIDGDDCALPGKLAKQVALLDAHPEAAAAFHRLEMVDSSGGPTGRHWPERAPQRFDLEYLLLHHPVVGHSSMMYRRGLLDELLRASDRFIDFRVYIELSKKGDLFVLADSLGKYTVNVGISSSNRLLPEIISAIIKAEEYGAAPELIRRALASQRFRSALNAFYADDHEEFKKRIQESVAGGYTSASHRTFYFLRRFPRVLHCLHSTYKMARRFRLVRDIKMDFGARK